MRTPSVEPGPVRVEVVDLEGALPDLVADGRHDRAWVVARRRSVPVAVVEVDLTGTPAEVAARLARLRDLPDRPLPAGAEGDGGRRALPRATVVVPSVVARLEDLRRCLVSLEEQDHPDHEVLLVDNRRVVGPDDPLPGIVADLPHVRVLREPRPGISAARNAGLAAADGEVVAFTDDDVRVDPGWLCALARRFVVEPGLDVVTGLVLPAELESAAQVWYERYYGGFSGERTFEPLTITAGRGRVGRARVTVSDAAGRPVRRFALYGIGAYGAGANMAFRREPLLRRGGFDLELGTGTPARGGEDLAALVQVLWEGGSIGYEPAAVVHHTHRRELTELERQLDGNGTGFTAMLTSLVRHDPGHAVALAAQLPLAAARMAGQSAGRLRGRRAGVRQEGEPEAGPAATPGGPDFPRSLVVTELRGMTRGPAAYARSVRAARETGVATAGAATSPAGRPETEAGPVRRGLERLGEDVRLAADHLLLTRVGGSVLLPGTARRLVYTAAGARVQSPPGIGFTFGGRARNLTVGRNVYMNQGVWIEAVGPVTIGDDVALGMEVMVVTSHHAIDGQGRWAPEAVGRAVSIGDRVWVGARATILPGAVIEPDVIIAAGAVVTGRCRAHGVYAGVPARRIREFDPPTREGA